MEPPKIKYRIAALLLALMLLVLVWERQPYRFLVRGQLFVSYVQANIGSGLVGDAAAPYYTGNRGMLSPWATTISGTL